MTKKEMTPNVTVAIKPPNFQTVEFLIKGIVPLVVHRFSRKTAIEMEQKMEKGKPAASSRNRDAKNFEDMFNEARYISKEGWDGFNASAIRSAMIAACRLVNFKMTLAKLAVFVEADGVDKDEPQIQLIRIYGTPVMQKDMARVDNGKPYIVARPAYHDWSARVKIRFDADQFTVTDVTNLLSRVGLQVGLCEGRPNSKNSAGMGWGLFVIADKEQEKVA